MVDYYNQVEIQYMPFVEVVEQLLLVQHPNLQANLASIG